jgi:hypothetical protein
MPGRRRGFGRSVARTAAQRLFHLALHSTGLADAHVSGAPRPSGSPAGSWYEPAAAVSRSATDRAVLRGLRLRSRGGERSGRLSDVPNRCVGAAQAAPRGACNRAASRSLTLVGAAYRTARCPQTIGRAAEVASPRAGETRASNGSRQIRLDEGGDLDGSNNRTPRTSDRTETQRARRERELHPGPDRRRRGAGQLELAGGLRADRLVARGRRISVTEPRSLPPHAYRHGCCRGVPVLRLAPRPHDFAVTSVGQDAPHSPTWSAATTTAGSDLRRRTPCSPSRSGNASTAPACSTQRRSRGAERRDRRRTDDQGQVALPKSRERHGTSHSAKI